MLKNLNQKQNQPHFIQNSLSQNKWFWTANWYANLVLYILRGFYTSTFPTAEAIERKL